MRIYLEGIDLSQGINDTDFPVSSQRNITRLYTHEGIFNVENGGINKLSIEDFTSRRMVVCGLDVCIDDSIVKWNGKVMYVPPVCHTQRLNIVTLMLRENARIWVTVEREGSRTDSVFLETKESIDNPLIKEDFATLVSKLKIS